MDNSIAHDVYEYTRNCAAFNIPVKYKQKRRNQYATVYTFEDRSQFIVYADFRKGFRNKDGLMVAQRLR